MSRDARISIRLSAETVARIDAVARERGCGRSSAVRSLLEDPVPARDLPVADEALWLRDDSALAGSVPARIALARLLVEPQGRGDAVQRRIDELATRRRQRHVA